MSKTKLDPEAVSLRLRKELRFSLIKLGMSPNTRIEEIKGPNSFYLNKKKGEYRYIAKLSDFFYSLDDEIGKNIFSDIYKESGHYPFWYVTSMSDKEHSRQYRKMVERLEGYIHGSEAL